MKQHHMANPNDTNGLTAELALYERLLPKLLAHAGQYAVIIGEKLIGTYSTWEDAYKVGYGTAGAAGRFLVKKIEDIETVNYFHRNILDHCPT